MPSPVCRSEAQSRAYRLSMDDTAGAEDGSRIDLFLVTRGDCGTELPQKPVVKNAPLLLSVQAVGRRRDG